MKTWDGLNAEEIASIPNDEYRLQKVERILRERNELKELSDEEIDRVVDETYGVPRNPGIYAAHRRLARAILKKASER